MDKDYSSKQRSASRVSIVVPIYNVEEDLAECLDSLLAQTYPQLQIILIDDGSTDNSGAIAQHYSTLHDHVEYHAIANQGLGHARNYGVSFATGDYLIFIDSDDVIEPFAIKKMVELAQQYDADIVIGNVDRFDSHVHWESDLHELALDGVAQVTSLAESPSLLFDTIGCDKLFRTEFYIQEDLQWAEGRLYEDISVTIPALYKARCIAVLHKVFYHWRVRDGATRSITQKRTEPRNFEDRLTALQSVDTFFDRFVTEEALWAEKDYKWLSLDFMIYLNVFDEGSDEFRNRVMAAARTYLAHANPSVLARLKAIDRIKYHFVQQNDANGVIEARKFQVRGMDALHISKKNGRFYGKFPFVGLTDDLCDMTDELRAGDLVTELGDITLSQDGLRIRFKAYMQHLHQLQPHAQIDLLDREGQCVRTFDTHAHTSPHSLRIEPSRDYKTVAFRYQPKRDFTATLSTEDLVSLQEGHYLLRLSFATKDIVCDPVFFKLEPSEIDERVPLNTELKSKVVSVLYDEHYRCALGMYSQSNLVRNIACTNTQLELSYADDQVETIFLPPLSSGVHTCDIRGCYTTTVPQFFAANTDGGMYCISAGHNASLRAHILSVGAILQDVVLVDTTRLQLRFSCALIQDCCDPCLVLVGKEFGAEVVVPAAVNNDSVVATIDFSTREHTKVLRDDDYAFFVECASPHTHPVRYPVYTGMDIAAPAHTITAAGYLYTFNPVGNFATLRPSLRVKRTKKFYEATPLRQRIVELALYPLFRLLPLQQHTVVFESYWGRSLDCNPYALCEYFIQNHPDYRCVLSVIDPRIVQTEDADVVIIGTLPFYYEMARAKYFVNNVNFDNSYRKRPGQIEIHTMHGTPLKKIGLDVEGEFPTEDSRNDFIEKCKRWNYLVVQSPFVADIVRHSYQYNGSILRTGYPRNDHLLADDVLVRQRQYKQLLGLDPNKTFVLYLPTWRSYYRFDLMLDFNLLQERAGSTYTFGLRRHHLSVGRFNNEDLLGSAIDFTHYPDLDTLLIAADILITDYSSVMFDYALLDRPMVFFTYDLEEYAHELRGFYLDFEAEAPGPLLQTTEEVASAITDLACLTETFAESYEVFKTKFVPYETGHASEAIFQQVFVGNECVI